MAFSKHHLAYTLGGFLFLLSIASFLIPDFREGDGAGLRNSAAEVDASLRHSVVWVITKDALKSCRTPAAALRRIQQAHHDDIAITVLYSGLEKDDVQYMMTRERITADLIAVDASAHQDLLGRPLKAAVHVIDDAGIRQSWDFLNQAHWWEANLSSHVSSALN